MALPALALGAAIGGLGQTLARFLVPYIVLRVLLAFGVATFSIVGITWLLDYVETQVNQNLGALLPDLSAVLLMAGVGDAIGILLASWTVALNLKLLKGGFKGFKFS